MDEEHLEEGDQPTLQESLEVLTVEPTEHVDVDTGDRHERLQTLLAEKAEDKQQEGGMPALVGREETVYDDDSDDDEEETTKVASRHPFATDSQVAADQEAADLRYAEQLHAEQLQRLEDNDDEEEETKDDEDRKPAAKSGSEDEWEYESSADDSDFEDPKPARPKPASKPAKKGPKPAPEPVKMATSANLAVAFDPGTAHKPATKKPPPNPSKKGHFFDPLPWKTTAVVRELYNQRKEEGKTLSPDDMDDLRQKVRTVWEEYGLVGGMGKDFSIKHLSDRVFNIIETISKKSSKVTFRRSYPLGDECGCKGVVLFSSRTTQERGNQGFEASCPNSLGTTRVGVGL